MRVYFYTEKEYQETIGYATIPADYDVSWLAFPVTVTTDSDANELPICQQREVLISGIDYNLMKEDISLEHYVTIAEVVNPNGYLYGVYSEGKLLGHTDTAIESCDGIIRMTTVYTDQYGSELPIEERYSVVVERVDAKH